MSFTLLFLSCFLLFNPPQGKADTARLISQFLRPRVLATELDGRFGPSSVAKTRGRKVSSVARVKFFLSLSRRISKHNRQRRCSREVCAVNRLALYKISDHPKQWLTSVFHHSFHTFFNPLVPPRNSMSDWEESCAR